MSQDYSEEPTYYPTRNPIIGGQDEEVSLLGHSSSAPAPVPATNTSSSFLPSWMSPSSSSTAPTVVAPKINAYPSLDNVGDRELTTYNSNVPTRNSAGYPVLSSYNSSTVPVASSRPVAAPVAMHSVTPATHVANVLPTPVAAPAPAPPRESTLIQVESTFIEDLIAENSRLTSELADLRQILQLQQQQLDETLSMRMPMPMPGTMSGVPLSSAAYNPNSGVSTLQSSPQLQGGTKNVCCGHCRKWLLVPIAANLIFCPNCERVNNCALAAPGQAINH